ncbi:hypothetical protein [Microbacterium sp. S1037]|uniref:hypothetical protein n=1 Tax=Microbacterium sp. S1037 TaxID=3398227 RepID=UPI003AB02789
MSTNPAPGDPSSAEGDTAAPTALGPAEPAPTETRAPGDDHAPAPRSRPRRSTVILGSGLALLVVAASAGFFWLSAQLAASQKQIMDQQQQITDQQRELEEQRAQLDRKEQFGAAMQELYATIDPLVGLPYASLVPWSEVEGFAHSAWVHRESVVTMERDITDVKMFTTKLANRVEAARSMASTNATGSPWEAALDSLGHGWVTMTYDESNRPCGLEAMACVSSADPFVVHVSSDTRDTSTLTDWMRTGVAYHEYSHVLQFTNPEATASALTAFGGNAETMADCYALTFLDGWTLDHVVPIDSSSYWEVSVGYGYTCDDAQRQVIRDWVGSLGVQKRTVSQ